MVTEKMIEAAARADAAHAGRTFEALSGADKTRFVERAKLMLCAALSTDAEPVAIPRNPTEQMMAAGLYHCSHDMEWSDLYTAWQAMFDTVTLDGGITEEAPAALSAPVQDVAGKPIGYMRKQDNDGNSFWVHRVQNAYYSEPVYAAAPAKQEG